MKSASQIIKEIEQQCSNLKQNEIEPQVLILGSLAYFTLKNYNKDKLTKTDNSGAHLTEFEGLRVIKRPTFEQGGIIAAEHESVEIFGN